MASALPLRTRADFTRWVLARLRHHRFDTVAQVDAAITELLSSVNDRPFQKLPGSRASVFAELDAPTLMSLPRQPYELARFKTVKVHIDYPPMATPNCSTVGQSNCSRQDGVIMRGLR